MLCNNKISRLTGVETLDHSMVAMGLGVSSIMSLKGVILVQGPESFETLLLV